MPDFEYHPSGMFAELERRAEAMCEAMGPALRLEHQRKPLLATLALKYRPKCKSMAEAEKHAYADSEYREYVDGMVIAQVAYERARAAYYDAQILAKGRQTEEVSRRQLTR